MLTKKKTVFLKFLILSMLIVLTIMLASCTIFDRLTSSKLDSDFINQNISLNGASAKSSKLTSDNITNLVILICFSDEDASSVFSNSVLSKVTNSYNDKNGLSLFNYYNEMSYNKFEVNSIFPIVNGNIYIYKDSNPRSYYLNNNSESGKSRYDPECRLLNTAINSASAFFGSDVDLDTNLDGYVDSVSFVVSGKSDGNKWGKIMWPHAWALDTITGVSTSGGRSSQIHSLYVENYIFTFANDDNSTSLTCHEFGHLLGLPDYYHTSKDSQYLPVYCWDIMHNNFNPPQRFLAYTQYKYLGFVSNEMIPEITKSGTYSLSPTCNSKYGDTIAYKVTLSDKESIYMEFRSNTNTESLYDSSLPMSGLVVYRVNNSVSGNENGRHNNSNSPDEVFVYRHKHNSSSQSYIDYINENGSSTRNDEIYELTHGALSTSNEADIYNHLGLLENSSVGRYNQNSIYLSNGTNTGIIINVTNQSDNLITFNISLGSYDSGEIKSARIVGKTLDGKSTINKCDIYYKDELDIYFEILYKNRSSYIQIPETQYTIVYDAEYIGTQTASLTFIDENNNEYIYDFELTIHDFELTDATLVNDINKKTYITGDQLELNGLSFYIEYASGNTLLVTYKDSDSNLYKVYEGINLEKIGEYSPTIIYNNSIRIKLNNIRVVSTIKQIYVNEINSNHIKTQNNPRVLNVYARFLNDEILKLKDSDYTITEGITISNKTSLRITLNSDESKFCESFYYNFDTQTIEKVEAFIDNNSTLIGATVKFGQMPNFEKNTLLSITLSSGVMVENIPLENYYDALIKEYNPTNEGVQNLICSIENALLNVRIVVLPKDESLLISTDENALTIIVGNGYNGYLKMYKEMNLLSLSSYLNSYLNISYIDDNGEYVNAITHPNRVIKSGYYIAIETNNKQILKLPIILESDLNGDGIINDYSLLLRYYFGINIENKFDSLNLIYLVDTNNDGKFNLDDFSCIYEKHYQEVNDEN